MTEERARSSRTTVRVVRCARCAAVLELRIAGDAIGTEFKCTEFKCTEFKCTECHAPLRLVANCKAVEA